MNKRLKKFLDFEEISVRQFESMIGSSDGKIAKFMATNSTLKSDTLNKIMEVFPQLSIEWLLTGEGEMLKAVIDKPLSEGSSDDEKHEGTTKELRSRAQTHSPV